MKLLLPILAVLIVALVVVFFVKFPAKSSEYQVAQKVVSRPTPIATPTPSPTPKPKLKYPVDYTIVLLGDSMTQALGNCIELTADLEKYYPNKSFQFLNYGFGATNILSVQDRLEKTTSFGRDFMPITDIDFDLILVESFGNNPLSQYSLTNGLKKQDEALDQMVTTLKQSNPRAKIVFYSTIAPNRETYAKTEVQLTPQKRAEWADERSAYIKNHMDYAKAHDIPLIDIYDKSADKNGDGNLMYIRNDDYIHPSPTGIIFISSEIAKSIFENKLLKTD